MSWKITPKGAVQKNGVHFCDLGTANSFAHLDESTVSKKIQYLQKVYNPQQFKSWFTDDLFRSLMRIRGMESNSPSHLAEAFYSRKNLLSF